MAVLDDPDVVRIRDEVDRRGWSQRALADRALLGEATIFRLFQGRYTRKTLRKVEQALDLVPRESREMAPEIADAQFGAYVRDLYEYMEGDYLFLRPSFSNEAMYCVYGMTIAWSAAERGLVFEDHNPGYEQRGVLAMPRGTQFVHFLTLDTGSVRLMSAFHMPPTHDAMHGLTLTFANPAGRALHPAAVPFVLKKSNDQLEPLLHLGGLIDRGHPIARELSREFESLAIVPLILNG